MLTELEQFAVESEKDANRVTLPPL
jgi:hypothetical protein